MIFNTYNWNIFVSSKIWCRIFLIVRVVLTSYFWLFCILAGDWWGRHQCTPLVLILKVREVKLHHTVSAATADFIGEGTIIYGQKATENFIFSRRKIGKYKFDQLKEKFCFRKMTTHVQWVCWVTMKSSSSPIKGKLKYSECTIIECIACRSLP